MTTTRRNFLTATGAVGLLGLGAVQTSGQAQNSSRDSFTIMGGTNRETTGYVTTADASGPTALVVGGIHGNEESGYTAAEGIAEWDIERGRLVTIPRANAAAIDEDARSPSGGSDLNRQFPTGEEPETELARAIWGVVQEYEPDIVIDLHESIGIFDGDMAGGVGQAIFHSWTEEATGRAETAADTLNSNHVSNSDYNFSIAPFSSSSDEPTGLLVHKAARDAGAHAFLAEVTSDGTSLDQRVQWHHVLTRQLIGDDLFGGSGGGGDGGDGGDDGGDGGDDGDDGGDEKPNESPVAKIRTTPDVTGGSVERDTTVTFDATKSEDPDGQIAAYRWDMDGDGSFEVEGGNFEVPMSVCGEHPVTLQVEDDEGATDTKQITVTVE